MRAAAFTVTPLLILLGFVVGCGKAAPPAADPTSMSPEPQAATPSATPPLAPAEPSLITVQMTAATLADDCGGVAPGGPPPKNPPQKRASQVNDPFATKAKRRCEQTSMQLSITAPATAKPGDVTVKQVEIFDETGKSLGLLAATAPRKWAEDSGYVDWDQKVAPGAELSVSYALGEPDWSKVQDRFNKTYVVKAVLSIGGTDRAVQTNVEVKATTSPPANVKT